MMNKMFGWLCGPANVGSADNITVNKNPRAVLFMIYAVRSFLSKTMTMFGNLPGAAAREPVKNTPLNKYSNMAFTI